MDSLKDVFSGGLPNPGGAPGGTPPFIDPSRAGGSSSGGGNWLTKLIPLFLAGSGVAGTIGNIQANRSRNAVLDQQMQYTKYLQGLTPTQITQMISQYQKPLSSNLINNVSNTVQGQMASRGLAQAPGIFAQAIGQGLAPYELQEQQLAQDALFKKLGLPISSRPSPFGPFPQTTNTSSIWQQLMQHFMGGRGSGPGNKVGQLPTLPSGTDWTNLIPGLTPPPSGGNDVEGGGG
jgi:hypothetical protein